MIGRSFASSEYSRCRIRDAHLLVDGRCCETDTLGPGEIEEVSESREEPDADLVATHTEFVELSAWQNSASACIHKVPEPTHALMRAALRSTFATS